jgi:DNA-binding IclR family transcriptional regulator
LANHLLRAADENGELAANMSRIASTIDIGRTTLYRVLDMLKADGSISYDGKKIRILNRELLEKRSRA